MKGAPLVFSWRLKISIIWGIIKTEDLKTKFFKIWRTEDIIILSFVTIETCCLRLKIRRLHIFNLKIQNLVLWNIISTISALDYGGFLQPNLASLCSILIITCVDCGNSLAMVKGLWPLATNLSNVFCSRLILIKEKTTQKRCWK